MTGPANESRLPPEKEDPAAGKQTGPQGKDAGQSYNQEPERARLEHVIAADLPAKQSLFDDEIVEGLLGRNSMAVIYGDSNTGKTFLAGELAASLSTGRDFLGHHTVGGLVIYLASEAVGSVELRLRAWQMTHKLRLVDLVVVRTPVNFFTSDDDAWAVIELCEQLAPIRGRPVLIVADTLARISAGANENAGSDMGRVFAGADLVRRTTGATFLWTHHSGKDQAKGMRGWSGMRAHIDTEVEITVDEATGIRTAEVTKQRDLPGKGTRIGFRLDVVPMGVNQWGNERTTCVVASADAPPKVSKGKRPSAIEGAIVEFLTARGTGCLRGALAKHFADRYPTTSVYRELRKMLEAGLLIEAAGVVALPGRPGPNA